MHKRYYSAQVAVIGSSLAGAACAIKLAQSGISVIILDRQTFPRRKACGEGLSHFAAGYLSQLGLDTELLSHKAIPLYGYQVISPATDSLPQMKCHIKSSSVHGWGISRTVLDTELLSRLSGLASASVLTEEAVRGLVRHPHSWELLTHRARISAQFVVLASGANPQALCRKFIKETRGPNRRVGLSAFGILDTRSTQRTVTIATHPLGEIYVTPLSDTSINASVVGSPEFVQGFREPTRLRSAIAETTGFAATLDESVFGAGHFGARHQSLDPYLYLVGDAFESFDPLCGLGMTHALSSGLSAATSICGVVRDHIEPFQSSLQYVKTHKKLASRVRRSSALIRAFITAFGTYPSATTLAHRWFGTHALTILDRLGPRAT